MNPDQIYEDVLEFPKLKLQMERNLIDYNEFPGQVPIDIVLFRDAIEHGINFFLTLILHLAQNLEPINPLSNSNCSRDSSTTRKYAFNRYWW